MSETQNIEYKVTWRDEYLKWICGFANANGGIIYIGKDDKGNVAGLANPKRLMEEIPNKARDILTDSNEHLIKNLQLKENDFLKRAAILLFHPNPENFVTGAYIKIQQVTTFQN